MTLATRCSACGTVFRVVQDQLRVSQGWVRCGRCGEPFNALESMIDLPPPRVPAGVAAEQARSGGPARAGGPEAGPDVAAPAADETAAADPAPTPRIEPARVADTVAVDPTETARTLIDLPAGIALVASDGAVGDLADVPREAGLGGSSPAATQGDDAEPSWEPREAAEPAEDRPGTRAGPPAVDACLQVGPAAAAAAAPAEAPPPGASEPVTAAEAAPSFIVAAERAARWRRPGVRAALSIGVLLAALGLASQVGFVYRDRVAAAAPGLRPLLHQACNAIGCRVGDLRQIDALSVESSALVRVEGSPLYRLAVTLRNRADVEIAAPALDLSLTDAQGRPIARRTLTMADLHLPLRTLKPGTELPIQVPLGIGDRQVSGYTVDLFYP